MQKFVFSTSLNSVYEIASFIKSYAQIKKVSVKILSFENSICVEFTNDVSYTTFSDFLLGVKVECRDCNTDFEIEQVLFFH